MLGQICQNGKRAVRKCCRVGVTRSGTNRPVKVSVDSQDIASLVLQCAKGFKPSAPATDMSTSVQTYLLKKEQREMSW